MPDPAGWAWPRARRGPPAGRCRGRRRSPPARARGTLPARPRAEPLGRRLGHGLLDDLLQDRGEAGDDLADRLRLLLHHLVEHGVHGVGVERLLAGEDLVEDAAEREDVGAVGPRARPAPARATCSAGVPMTMPVRVMSEPETRARPKSMILTWPSGSRWMLAGFRSRWTMSWAWAKAKPVADLAHDVELVLESVGSGPPRWPA